MKEQLQQVKICKADDPLIDFEIKRYYEKEPRFIALYSGSDLPKINDGT